MVWKPPENYEFKNLLRKLEIIIRMQICNFIQNAEKNIFANINYRRMFWESLNVVHVKYSTLVCLEVEFFWNLTISV